MRKFFHNIYYKYYAVSDDNPLTETSFLGRITVYITGIVICLFCIAYSSYAFFSANNYKEPSLTLPDISFQVTDSDGNYISESPIGGYVLDKDCSYTVTVSCPSDEFKETFYCDISVISNFGNIEYKTCQISSESPLSFQLFVSSQSTLNYTFKTGIYYAFRTDDVLSNNESIVF